MPLTIAAKVSDDRKELPRRISFPWPIDSNNTPYAIFGIQQPRSVAVCEERDVHTVSSKPSRPATLPYLPPIEFQNIES